MKIDFAKMTKWITIQYADKISDESGDSITTWYDHKSAWAQFMPLKTIEFKGRIIGVNHHYQVITRFMPISPNIRIQYRERVFEVISVTNHKEQSKYLIINVREKL